MNEQDRDAAMLKANKLGFFTHMLAAGQSEKQASAAYDKAMTRQTKMEKLAAVIRGVNDAAK